MHTSPLCLANISSCSSCAYHLKTHIQVVIVITEVPKKPNMQSFCIFLRGRPLTLRSYLITCHMSSEYTNSMLIERKV